MIIDLYRCMVGAVWTTYRVFSTAYGRGKKMRMVCIVISVTNINGSEVRVSVPRISTSARFFPRPQRPTRPC